MTKHSSSTVKTLAVLQQRLQLIGDAAMNQVRYLSLRLILTYHFVQCL